MNLAAELDTPINHLLRLDAERIVTEIGDAVQASFPSRTAILDHIEEAIIRALPSEADVLAAIRLGVEAAMRPGAR